MMDKITMSILFSADRPLCARSGRCLHHGMLVYREQVTRARKAEASTVSSNRLQRLFNPDAPDERWVTECS